VSNAGGFASQILKPCLQLLSHRKKLNKKTPGELENPLGEFAERVYDRLSGQLLEHREASQILGVHPDTLQSYRAAVLILGIPKKPHARRKSWLYRHTDVLELRYSRSGLPCQGGYS